MFITDLNTLTELLNSFCLCKDTEALQKIIGGSYKINESESFSYDLGCLEFTPDKVSGIIPHNVNDLNLKFSMSIKYKKNDDSILIDPLEKLVFEIELFGKDENDGDLYSSWHFDRHIGKDIDNECQYSHPIYHFTFGGNRMEESNYDFGNSLILPSPRIAYPPMDLFLGIDFILQNYINKEKTKKMLNSKEYKEIIIKSQIKLWKPYFTSLYSYWDRNVGQISSEFSPIKLFPLYY